ncbi:Gti1/Pac2 family-domain-containing protein [Xylariaceae sp. FL0255]|nr:Gti1/Pac2 family-domain-containing protein [Xylariaceae sp. FL0255]
MASQSTNSPMTPTFQGYIATTMDALILFEACLAGPMSHVPRRPHDRERPQLIKSGNVFIYEEHSSGIKRWTDGVPWSPSRILGNFLLYRELEKPFTPGEKKRAIKKKTDGGVQKSVSNTSRSNSITGFPDGINAEASTATGNSVSGANGHDANRHLIGSLVDSYTFKKGGLVKKTISVVHRGVQHHLVSYYTVEDVQQGKLKTPHMTPGLNQTQPRGSLISSGNFRAPVDEQEYMVGDPQQLMYANHGFGNFGGYGLSAARSLSVPSVTGYQTSWAAVPNQYQDHSAYGLGPGMTQSLPGTQFGSTSQVLGYIGGYPDAAYRHPSQAAYATMQSRRHSIAPNANGSSQLGHHGLSSADRSHMGTASMQMAQHGLANSTAYLNSLIEQSATEAAADSTAASHGTSGYGQHAALQANGYGHDMSHSGGYGQGLATQSDVYGQNASDAANQAYHNASDAANQSYHNASDATSQAYHTAPDATSQAYHSMNGTHHAATGYESFVSPTGRMSLTDLGAQMQAGSGAGFMTENTTAEATPSDQPCDDDWNESGNHSF